MRSGPSPIHTASASETPLARCSKAAERKPVACVSGAASPTRSGAFSAYQQEAVRRRMSNREKALCCYNDVASPSPTHWRTRTIAGSVSGSGPATLVTQAATCTCRSCAVESPASASSSVRRRDAARSSPANCAHAGGLPSVTLASV